MPLEPFIPSQSTLNIQILINGELSGLHTFLKKVDCHYEFNKIPFAKLLFISSNPDTTSEEDLLESDTLAVTDAIEIQVSEGNETKTLFKGMVYRLERNVGSNCGFETKVECKDVCVNLMSQQDVVADETFSTKMDRFLNHLQISNEVDLQVGGDEIVSKTSNTTPWDYILSYLDTLGLMTTIKEGVFKAFDSTAQAFQPLYLAENGVNVFEFEGTQESTVSNVVIRTWNPETQEIETQDNETNVENSEGSEVIDLSQTNYSNQTKNQISIARAAKNRLATTKGKVKTFGNLQANYGDYIQFEKVNQNIDASPLIISAEHHTIENGCWQTEYSFGLENNNSFAENVRGSRSSNEDILGQSNTMQGLQIGVVTKIDGDSEFRIKVRIPSISDSGEGVWARLASIQAGPDRGGFFIPEVDDEVVLGCFNNNPDTPVILGKLYSSARPAPFSIKEKNYIQGFVSKEGTKIIIDDEKKTVEISTKANQQLIIGDDKKGFYVQDKNNGSTISVNDKGITLDSKKDIILKAAGNIKIEGIENSFKASGNMNLEGAFINLN
ncbi:phage baseplate assembly protein V [uncultured Psychroserpens sp.]|uniref:phage baseplate assembly protein V n=1 Tax=uncultured Psychroserpens sp. TaxID=255436 RepID=UPI00262E1D7D|nr:phage baseplate assembly protein V [uncultured Psychroserpens sp.]